MPLHADADADACVLFARVCLVARTRLLTRPRVACLPYACHVCAQVYQFNDNPGEGVELSANHPGITPLMLAASEGDIAAARLLLRRGASIGLVNCYGRTALMMAAMGGHTPMVRLLLSLGAAVDIFDA